jgi:hypothetical protein
MNKFIIDDTNPHSNRFKQIDNTVKKLVGGSWDSLLNKIQISRT